MIIAKILCLIAIAIICLIVICFFASSLISSIKDFFTSYGGNWYITALLVAVTLFVISGSIVIIILAKGELKL